MVSCQCSNDNHTSTFPSLCVLGCVWIFVSAYWLGGFPSISLDFRCVSSSMATTQPLKLGKYWSHWIWKQKFFFAALTLLHLVWWLVLVFPLCICFLNLQCSWNSMYFLMLQEILTLSLLLFSYHTEVMSRMYVSEFIDLIISGREEVFLCVWISRVAGYYLWPVTL